MEARPAGYQAGGGGVGQLLSGLTTAAMMYHCGGPHTHTHTHTFISCLLEFAVWDTGDERQMMALWHGAPAAGMGCSGGGDRQSEEGRDRTAHHNYRKLLWRGKGHARRRGEMKLSGLSLDTLALCD